MPDTRDKASWEIEGGELITMVIATLGLDEVIEC